jgi:predicted phosphodiesterase
MRVFAVSDLHADYAENRAWVAQLSAEDYQQDVLILAGDVTDNLKLLRDVLRGLRTRFREVLFVPGNHELWVQDGAIACSLEKFELVNQLCDEEGVRRTVWHDGNVSFVPLYSWYDFSFGEPDRHLLRAWRDFRACAWPSHLQDAAAINQYFLALNEPVLQTRNETVISFSHFLPRIDVMSPRIPEERRRVYPVLGSKALGQQINDLRPTIHVYGHSHVNQSIELDSVRYINNAFAYPNEERIARKGLHCIYGEVGDAK